MIILGIDPGLRFAGFSILKKNGTQILLLDAGYAAFPQKKTVAERVALFHDFFLKKIESCSITDIVLETPFLGRNAQNFLKLGYLRGVVYLLTQQHSLDLHEFSPREIKQAVTGFGGASKEQVARIVLQLFPRLTHPKKSDVTDAIAISLCGVWRAKQYQ